MRISDARVFDSSVTVITLRLLIVWTVWFFVPGSLASVLAEDDAIPSWQKGVSLWNGSSYDMPETTQSNATTKSIAPLADKVPYTVPTDPTAPRRNPYTHLPKSKSNNNAIPYVAPSPVATNPDTGAAVSPRQYLPPIASAPAPETPVQKPSLLPDEKTPAKGEAVRKVEPLPLPKGILPEEKTAKPIPPAIGEKIVDADAVAEVAPLQDEVIRWYQYPRRWMRGWDSHAEFGLDGSSGNSDTVALQTGMELTRQTELYSILLDVDYRLASNQDVTTEDNGRFNYDIDRLFKDSPWSTFGKYGMEWDEFKAFDLRLNFNGGLGYHWIREDDTTFVTRFGAGTSKEIGAPDDDWVAEAVFGVDATRQINSRHKVKARVDYFPAWEAFANYRLVADVAWEILLDDEDNFSLKLAATDRYDSTPQGAEPNDVYYSLLLLYKF